MAHLSRYKASPSSFCARMYGCLSRVAVLPPKISPSAFSMYRLPSMPLLGQCQLPCSQQLAGMKTKTALKRRCQDCFFVRRRGRLFVFCKTNPRHKQRQA
ncbi:RM36 protein, partial [Amia calva]|nr:RM36 protein [Amia calva]